MDPLDLSGLISARLCHDLAGSVGVLINGAELLSDEDDPAVRAEFLGMISAGAAKLAAQLRFYRLAYGSGATPMATQDARQALAELLALDDRVALVWESADIPVDRTRARLVLVLAIVGLDAIIRRGQLTIFTGSQWWVEAQGDPLFLPPDQRAILTKASSPGEGSRAAPAHLAVALADRSHQRIAITDGPRSIRLTIAP